MNQVEFKTALANDTNLKIAETIDDSVVATDILQKALIKLLDIWAPFKTIQLKQKFLPYLSEATKDTINERDKNVKKQKVINLILYFGMIKRL